MHSKAVVLIFGLLIVAAPPSDCERSKKETGRVLSPPVSSSAGELDSSNKRPPTKVIFEDKFLDAPQKPMGAAYSYLFPNDPVLNRTNADWEAPSGSSSGSPFWIVREGSQGYLSENVHPSPWSEKEKIGYYYSGILSKRQVVLEPGYTYTIEEELKVSKWWSFEEERAVVDKIQIDILGYRSTSGRMNALSFFTVFGPGGGYTMIGLDDPTDTTSARQEGGFNWIILGRDGWEWVEGQGVYGADRVLKDTWFKVQFTIRCEKGEVGFTLSMLDKDGKKLQSITHRTKEKRALAFYGQPMRIHIQCAQNKSKNDPERNFKMRRIAAIKQANSEHSANR